MRRLLPMFAILVFVLLGLTACMQTIAICKATVPPGGTGFSFTSANTFGPLPPFTLNDGHCIVRNVTTQDHSNRFTEQVPLGWTLSNITCAHTTSVVSIIGANPNPSFQPGDTTAAIDVNEFNVTCTFVNQNPCLCGDQINVSTGQGSPVDPNWTVNGNPAYTTSTYTSWMPLPPAAWIQPINSTSPQPVLHGVYQYAVTFNVAPCHHGHVQLGGQFAADNSAVAYLDGVQIASCTVLNCFNNQGGGQAPISLNAPVVSPGTHTLRIDVTNGSPPFTIGSSYSGLIVNASLTRRCP